MKDPSDGATVLPPGFWHPHAVEQARAVAEAGMILRVQVVRACTAQLLPRTALVWTMMAVTLTSRPVPPFIS